ncbi:MAG: uroporphyrinogen decarboxylase family protein, partial [SAR324 cluster bacterium]|nr:uroporphyrinogen decarboxylase family protein [SAR324 cluster bacterium]
MSVLKNDRLLRVLKHLPVDRVPVWLMRQAGRTD